jgi:hypothetical protein
MYVVSGGWGAPLYTAETNSLTASTASVYHFVVVDVSANGTLSLRAIDTQGEIFDTASITRVIPEFPSSFLLLLVFTMATFLIVIMRGKLIRNNF